MRDIKRFARMGVLLVVLGLVTGAMSASASGGATKASKKGLDPALVQELRNNARGSVALSTEQATKRVGFVRAGQNGDLLPAAGLAKAKAGRFLREYGGLLGADSESSLVEITSTKDSLGATHVTYQQYYKGVPVWAGLVKAHVDRKGNLTAVNGVAVPNISLNTKPQLSASEAAARAIATVVADPPADESGRPANLSASDLRSASTKLYVYRMGLPRGATGTSQLVYEVTVTNGSSVRDVVFVHANVGKVVNRYSETADALFRRVFEQRFAPANQVWQEGDPFPGTLNIDQQNIVNFSGNSYWHFRNAFGRDSYDAAGAELQTVNNDPTIACPNANWNGRTTNYCNGVTSDDVVAHEWGHAYTQYTHDLIYQWQPGALNESYSDIWGETVDQINGVGTDSPGGVRTVGSCSTHTGNPTVVINSPASIARNCPAGRASFGPAVDEVGTTGNVVLADDGAAPTSDACTPFVNAGAVSGNIALVDRGTCGFAVKVKLAQDAGAIAVVVANNIEAVQGMGGTDPTITIPSLLISLSNGNAIKGELASPVNVSLKEVPVSGAEDSYRWLMGEDATAFGGAIRDMWTPTCLGDPGKVSDAQYHCDTSDGGGVHSNSGVPNHGYALLVDGGTYNGRTVTALGLVKAAHIYWRAQSVYQTPTTDFEDHADALEASCTDLAAAGTNLAGLSTSSTPAGPSGQVITAADCVSVTEVIAAIELRRDPTAQCNFKPALSPNPPGVVCPGKTPKLDYTEDFEDGLVGWTVTNTGVFSGWAPPTNWVHDTSLPGGRLGSAAFAEDRDGSCDGGAGDRSGVMRLASPTIKLRKDSTGQLVTFQHYFATEFSFDGGNVKISINGGAYQIVPASAFRFNAYNATMATAAGGNTSPLAGEPGFTGTDGGQVTGTWGESQIDLTKLGAKADDTIRLRFDFGMDGCGAIDGWYVDDVKVFTCAKTKGGASAGAEFAAYRGD